MHLNIVVRIYYLSNFGALFVLVYTGVIVGDLPFRALALSHQADLVARTFFWILALIGKNTLNFALMKRTSKYCLKLFENHDGFFLVC